MIPEAVAVLSIEPGSLVPAPMLRTGTVEVATGSALSPLAEEVTWRSWRLVAANPRVVTTTEGVLGVAGLFDRLLETIWSPGRVSAIAELSVVVHDDVPVVNALLGIGVFGARGATPAESDAVHDLVSTLLCRPGTPYLSRPEDPVELLDRPDPMYCALIQQRMLDVDVADGVDLQVLSRWHPTIDPWSSVARLLAARRATTSVRATVVPTELSADDRLALQASLAAASAFRASSPLEKPDVAFHADRVVTTIVDVKESFASPLMVAELAISSDAPLPEMFLRGIATAFTSEVDVLRHGRTVVAGQRLILGGFDIERDPRGFGAARRAGVPLRGGLEPRELRHLITLTENVIKWPVPTGGEPLAGISTMTAHPRPVPRGLKEGLLIGYGETGECVRLPHEERDRHLLLLGVTGTGKTTVMCRSAIDDLSAGHGFILIDPHGAAADRVVAHADELGRSILVLDPDDPASARVSLVPSISRDLANLDEVERAIGHCCDAIATNFPDPAWTGPRWHTVARGMLALQAALGIDVADVVTLVNDSSLLDDALREPLVPDWAKAALGLLHVHSHSDSAAVREWVCAKFTSFTSGAARNVLARSGEGEDLEAAVHAGSPVIVNLAALPESDAGMLGHVILARVVEAAMRRKPEARQLISVYVDEAHRFPVRNLERILAEGRKFGVSLNLATQSLLQLPPSLADAVSSANVRVAFRQAPESAARIAPLLDIPASELADQPNLHAYVKVAGHPTCSLMVPPYDPSPPPRPK